MPITTEQMDEKTMPQLGNIKVQKRHGYVWTTCTLCGKERWVALKHGRPCRSLCFACAMSKRRTSIVRIPNDKDYLYDLYWNQESSLNKIGLQYHVGPGTVARKFQLLGIRMRTKKEGVTLSHAKMRGPNNPNWKGGRTQNGPDGYVFIYKPGHPHAHQNYVREHILVWEEVHSMPLPPRWEVHHFNGVKNDNRPENLLGMESRKHKKLIAEYQRRIKEVENQLEKREVHYDHS